MNIIHHSFNLAKLFKFLLGNAQNFFAEQAENPNVDSKMKSAFINFFEYLGLYMDQKTIVDESKVMIYDQL